MYMQAPPFTNDNSTEKFQKTKSLLCITSVKLYYDQLLVGVDCHLLYACCLLPQRFLLHINERELKQFLSNFFCDVLHFSICEVKRYQYKGRRTHSSRYPIPAYPAPLFSAYHYNVRRCSFVPLLQNQVRNILPTNVQLKYVPSVRLTHF